MTKHEVTTLDSILVGPAMLIFNQYFNTFLSEHLVLWLALTWTVLDVLLYGSKVCIEISNHLQINVFSIEPRLPSESLVPSVTTRNGRTSMRGSKGGTITGRQRGQRQRQ